MFTRILSLMFFISALAWSETKEEMTRIYITNGKQIVEMANSKTIDNDKIATLVLAMEKQAVALARLYSNKFPTGKNVLNEVIACAVVCNANGEVTELGKMKELTYSEIEKNWHDLGHFKGDKKYLDLTNEDNEHFTDPIHTIVHPLMALRAAIEYKTHPDPKLMQAIKEETEEGLEQINKTVSTLTK